MTRSILLTVAAMTLVGAQAFAQERLTQGTLEVTAIPGGGMKFISTDTQPGFSDYDLGGALSYKVNPHIAVEGELGGTLGVAQDLAIGGTPSNHKPPATFGYTGNVVFSGRPVGNRLFPYLATGIGGLTAFQRAELGINDTQNFLTGNVGGGVRWYANDRWGLRADYRFIAMRSGDDGAAFFGQESRYANRVYGGVVLKVVR